MHIFGFALLSCEIPEHGAGGFGLTVDGLRQLATGSCSYKVNQDMKLVPEKW